MLFVLFLSACSQNNEKMVHHPTKLQHAAIYNTRLGLAYLQQGNVVRAKTKLLAAMQQDPNLPEVQVAMAYFFERTKDFEAAKAHYLKAISLSPQSGEAMNNYAAFLCGRKDYANAEQWFLKAILNKQYINTAAAYENAGICAKMAGDFAKSTMYLTKALDYDPSRKKALFHVLSIQNEKGNLKKALILLEKYQDSVLQDKELLLLAKNITQSANRLDLATFYNKKLGSVDISQTL